MVLTPRTFALLAATTLPLALMAGMPWMGWVAAAWLLLVFSLLLAEWLLTPSPGAWSVRRSHDSRLSLATQNAITLDLELHRSGAQVARPVPVWVRDEPPPTFAISEAERILEAQVMPGKGERLLYHLRPPRRGDYRFGDIWLRWQGPLGLLRRTTRVPAAAAVKVYPNLVDVKKYDLLLRRNRLWQLGLRSTRVQGAGSDFERLREYLPDDEYRRINWKATARRGKPITTEYQSERSQNIMVLLDVGRMMRSPVGDVAKMDYAINAVLLLAYVAAQKGDKVGLLTFADSVSTWVSPRAGKGQFQRMLEQLYALEGEAVEPDYGAAFAYLGTRLNKHSLVLVFTELTGSISTATLLAQLTRLRRRHLPLLVTVGDPTVQALARQPVADSDSLYQRTVAEELLEERRLILDKLQRSGVHTLDVAADELSVAVINRYLEIKERQLL